MEQKEFDYFKGRHKAIVKTEICMWDKNTIQSRKTIFTQQENVKIQNNM